MAKAVKRTYTDIEKAAAVSLYQEVGLAEASRKLKIPRSTIMTWAQRAGVRLADPPPKMAKANAAFQAVTEARRKEMAAKLMERANRLADRLIEREVDHKGQNAIEVQYAEMTPASARHAAEAISKLLDKVQLLTGEATDRTEQVSPGDMERWLLAAGEGYAAAKEIDKARSE